MQACAEGFILFQGYFFCRPLLLENRKVPANRFAHFQILELLRHDPLNLHRLSELVKQDTLSLTDSCAWSIRRCAQFGKSTVDQGGAGGIGRRCNTPHRDTGHHQ